MTLNGQNALCRRKDASFGAHCTNMNEDRPMLSATKVWANESSFWQYKVYGDIRWGSPGWRASNDSGVIDDGTFWRFVWLLLRKHPR